MTGDDQQGGDPSESLDNISMTVIWQDCWEEDNTSAHLRSRRALGFI